MFRKNRILVLLLLSLPLQGQDVDHEEPKVRQPLPSAREIGELPRDGGEEFNRLVFEASPYLRQHARNPVDWYPWCDEAFDLALKLDKPIFLSIGYSTCHWCHVMEHESFEDEDVAALMNEHFVCIKVDREERPDVDHVYMSFAQAFGRGGWPMTVLMAPDQKPFHAGTYYPKTGRGGRPGMMEMLPQVAKQWEDDRANLLTQSNRLVEWVKSQNKPSTGRALGKGILDMAQKGLMSGFDPRMGGFSQAPKFPVPHNLRLLLREHAANGTAQSLQMVELTLDQMRKGGIWDHVGFGFHRYSTDAKWLVPHFEKMLYDQALLAMAYTEAWQVTGKAEYAETVEQIFTYVLRDMTAHAGGFYSAEDADSEGEEGLFYFWTEKELRSLLAEEDADLFIDTYNVRRRGNFRDGASGGKSANNILHLNSTLAEIAARHGAEGPVILARLERIREKLFAAREKRIHPLKDDKILTDWNGLMIAALAQAGRAMDRPDWVQAADRAAEYAWNALRDPKTGRLYKRSRGGKAGLQGMLEDYAFMAWGMIELHQATQDPRRLAAAEQLCNTAIKYFWDKDHGGFFLYPSDGEELIVRAKEVYDGALPSGNSVMLWNLARMGRLTGRVSYEEHAERAMRAFSNEIRGNARAHTQFLVGVDFFQGPTYEVVISGDPMDPETKAMLKALSTGFRPRLVVLQRPPGEPAIVRLSPFTLGQVAVGGKPTAYVCQDFACLAPVHGVQALLMALAAKIE
ncbi:MAG: thioredoxin domain-containing protein [bacterium]|nr:thioredoxin domain-containing protein [bacterium]